MSYQRSGSPKDGRRRYRRYPNRAHRYGGYSPVPTRNYKDISYAGNVGDRPAVGNRSLPPIAQSYDHRPLHQHGGGTRGQARVDSSSSSHSRAGDKKSQATDEADDKHQRGYRKSSEKQRSGSSHHDLTSSHEDPANSRDAHTSSRDSHAHGDKISFPDSHSRDGDGKKSSRQKSDGDRKAGKLSRLNLDVVLQDEQLTNLLFAGISKATVKLDQSLKTTDTKLENYASIDDSASRDKAKQSVQTSSAEGLQKPKSILKRNTREERVDVESKVSTESQVSSDSFSKLTTLEKTLHLLCGKTNVEDVVRGSEKGSRGSEKPSFKPVGALSQLESYNDSGDDYDHAEKDTKKQTKTKKSARSTQPFWSKMDQLSQQTGQTPNLASFSQAKKAGDNNEEELDSTVQNILQSIGFNFDLSKRPQELARQKEQKDVLHTGMINQSASFLGQSNRLVKGVRAALFSDKQKKAQPDSLIKETGASMQKRPDYERSASGDTFSADTQSGKSSYSRKGKNPEPDNDRSRMGLGSHEIRSDRHLENLQNKDLEQISPDEDEMDGIESRQIIKKMKTLSHEKHAGNHEKSLRPSERFRDGPKNEYIYQDVSKSITIKAAALLAALCSKQKEVSSSGSKSLKLPLQSGSAQVENPRVTSRAAHSDDNKNGEPYIESRKMSLPSKSDVRIVSQSPVFRKSQSPEIKVPRKRPASPLPCPVSKEKEDRVLNEKRSFSVLQAFLKTSFEKNAPGFCQAPGLNVDSCDKLPLLQTLLGGLNVGGLPAAESTRSPVMSDHFDRDSVRKSPDRPTLISPDVRTSRLPGTSRSPERRKAGLPDVPVSRAPSRPKSRSPDKRKSVSPDKRKSTSLDRRLCRSPDRRSSRLPDKMKSKSPNRQMSRSPVRRKSSLPGRRVSKSPNRRKSIASSRCRSRSPDRHRSRSPDRRRSRSPDRHKSRSPDRPRPRSPGRHRSRSPDRHRSRSSDRHRSRSSDRHRSRSPYRRRSRSSYRRRSRSPGKGGSRSPKRPRATSVERSKSRSPYRLKARSPARYKSKSTGRYRSQSTSRCRSSSPGRHRIRSPSVLPSQAISSLNQQILPAGQQNLPPQVQSFNAIPPVNQQMWPAQQQNLVPQVQTFNAIPPLNQQMLPTGQQNFAPQVQTSHAIPPLNQQMLPTGQQNFAPQVQTSHAIPPLNQQMWPAGQQNFTPQVQTFNAIPPLNQQMLPTGQQNFTPQVQTFNAIPPLNQQMLPTGQQNFAPHVQTSHAIPPLNQQMWPAGQQNFAPQVQTSHAIPPLNQQMLPTGQQNFAPQVQISHAIPPLNQQMWPAGQQNFAPQVQTSHAIPPLNQQMLPTGQQNFAPQVQTSHARPPRNQQMWPAGQQNFAPRTAAPNWPAAQNWQLPQYQRQNVYRDTNTTIINTYNMIVLPAQENIPTMYEEDWEELPATQSEELSEEQKKEPLKEQPKEQVQELPNVQEKEPEKEQEQQNQDLSKSATKNDTKLEVDIFGEFPVYERKIIFKKMALMNTAERQKLAQDLSQTQTKLAELKAEMAKLVKEQNEIMQQADVVNANLPELTQNKKAQANLTEEVRRLLKASNYIPEKTQVSGDTMIPKLKTPQIKKQKPLATGNSRVSAKRQKLKGKLTGSTKPWLSKSSNQNMATMSPDDYPLREDHKDTNTRLPVIESVTLNGFITTCLYDTALQFDAIIATSLVNPDQVTDEIIKIQGPVKGSVPLSLPVAKVKIISHYVTGEIRAAVLDDPIYPVMLGCRYIFLREPVHPMIASAMTTGQQATKAPASTPTNPQPEEFKQAQAADSTLAACFHKLRRTHTPPYTGQMYMKNGLLHKRTGKKGQEHAQLIVPSSYRAQILDMGHILSFNGHMDISATMERISAHYFWPGMNPDIVRYVKSCPQCQRVAPKNLVAASTLGQMRIPHTPFEKVAVDIVGPFKRTERRNCYILTLVDTFSMWAEIVPMPSSNSKHVAKALLSIFTRLGFPLRIQTDNRSQFRGKLMEEVFRLFQSRQIHTSPYYPVSSGNLKQFNGTLFSILRTLAHEQPETWDTYVPAALFAYREVPHDSTGIAPATFLFRRPIKGLLEALLRTWTDDQVDETIVNAPTYVAELNRLQYGWKLASDNLQKVRNKIGRCYKKKDRELEVGEKVLLLLSASQNKMQIGWKGPYEVIDKISRTNYRISILGKQKIFHINLLRKYNERPTTETAHLMTLAEAIEVDHGITMGVEYPLQAKETYVDVDISPALTQDQLQQIQDLLASYAEILTDKPGHTDLVEFDIKLNDPTPVQVKTYPVPYAKATALKDEIQQMLSSGIISPSESPYSASVVLLRKPCGEHRLCIDYRQLNAVMEFQAEPLPDQSQLFTILSRAKYFTRIDISKGYYQIPVKPEVRPWLAFSTPDGHYEFNVVPFGLSNAPSAFTRMMRKLLEPLHHSAISNFMDDILIATETFEEHSKALHLFFKRLKETGLTARPKKCQIGFQQLDFLGHTISQGFMTPLEGNIEKLQQAPCPRTKKDVTSFVSLCGCYQKYIKDFSSLTAPLTNLTRKEEPETVIWSAECDEAYSALKKALTAEPVLHLPDLKQPFILRTDASNIGIGATLLQRKEDEHSLLFPVAYASRKLNTAERNYSTIEKECLALVWAVEKFQAYLYGKHFTVQFDHQPLMFLAASGDLNARLMRWSLLLQPYSFQIEYIPGKSNVGADFLSRHPVPDTVTETKEKGNQEEEMDYI